MRADYGSYSTLPTSKLTGTLQNVYISLTDWDYSDESQLGRRITSVEQEVKGTDDCTLTKRISGIKGQKIRVA